MINFYEITGEINYLDDAKQIVRQTWDLFYDKENKILQKNPKTKYQKQSITDLVN